MAFTTSRMKILLVTLQSGQLFYALIRWTNCDSERLSLLPKVTQGIRFHSQNRGHPEVLLRLAFQKRLTPAPGNICGQLCSKKHFLRRPQLWRAGHSAQRAANGHRQISMGTRAGPSWSKSGQAC